MTNFISQKIYQASQRIIRPGLTHSQGTERYTVKGGGSLVLQVFSGDIIRIVDVEGLQRVEASAFVGGRWDTGVLGSWGSKEPSLSDCLIAQLQSKGMPVSGLRVCSLLGVDSRAGAESEIVIAENAQLLISAPGQDMHAHAQYLPGECALTTELHVYVERANPVIASPIILPDPFADPLQDFQIDRGTARAYEVKAGEWIQVIDVAGRQCSDLQVFSKKNLDKNIELCLDVTATRTLMGHGYPHPGQHAKYYDHNFNPLLEVVQDNCMRHDAFGTACTSKYYDDAGYPGHINCSDNFNTAISPYGIRPRAGWMAMNFFYNTGVDDHNQFYLDEPWSRPGDYVLMRALEDLVCVSSSCPDDIDAANGWNPTDIHLRVYDKSLKQKRSIGFRKNTHSEVEMTKETGFHIRTSQKTRDFVEYNGYWLANSYTNHGAIAEYWACRERAIIMDLTALRKFEILGPDAEALLQYCLTRNIRKLAVGQVVYTAMCYETGTMIDDGTLFRLGPDNFRWIGGCDFGGEWLRKQAKKLGLEVWVKSSTDQLHNLAIQGPLSRDILKSIIWTEPHQASLDELQWFRFSIARIGNAQGIPITVSRTGYTGELGYEVFCHPKDAPAVWDAIYAAGEPHGMLPLGLEALDMLRIESGLIFADYEFDDQTDPFEAGIGFTVPLKSKEEDFIGREALLKRKENPQRVLVGLDLDGDEMAAHGDCVRIGHQQVGVVTSAVRSPILGKNIALCRIAIEHAERGTQVEVGKLDGHQKRLPAKLVPLSFYDPEKSRPRS
jgi:aminomethyltransferase